MINLCVLTIQLQQLSTFCDVYAFSYSLFLEYLGGNSDIMSFDPCIPQNTFVTEKYMFI